MLWEKMNLQKRAHSKALLMFNAETFKTSGAISSTNCQRMGKLSFIVEQEHVQWKRTGMLAEDFKYDKGISYELNTLMQTLNAMMLIKLQY